MDRDAQKRAAAEAAVAQIEDGMAVGIGTGSTAAFAIEALIRRVRDGLKVTAIPTSEASARLARDGGIQLVDFSTAKRLDLTFDGADQVQRGGLALIKGMGGALLREKIVAVGSERLIIMVDEGKLADELALPVPVEVVEFGWPATLRRIEALGLAPMPRPAQGGGFYRTDGGNLILDCDAGTIRAPEELDARLREIVGVVETGLFIGLATTVLVAGDAGVTRLERDGAGR